jgi:hypothetical protein
MGRIGAHQPTQAKHSSNSEREKPMIQKNLTLVVTLLSLQSFQSSSLAGSGLIGSPAPYFRVQSGDDKELTLDMIKGQSHCHILRDQRHCGKEQKNKR